MPSAAGFTMHVITHGKLTNNEMIWIAKMRRFSLPTSVQPFNKELFAYMPHIPYDPVVLRRDNLIVAAAVGERHFSKIDSAVNVI